MPSPALKLFVPGTQWIDAFAGRLAPQVDVLATQSPRMVTASVSGHAKPKPTAPVRSSLLRSPRVLGAASLAAIRLDPKNVQAYTGRAISYQKKGDIAQAKVDYEKALSLDPDAETRKD